LNQVKLALNATCIRWESDGPDLIQEASSMNGLCINCSLRGLQMVWLTVLASSAKRYVWRLLPGLCVSNQHCWYKNWRQALLLWSL